MKIYVRGNDLIVFLNKFFSSKINFFDKLELEKYFRELFLKIKKFYSIDFVGSYNISVFIDKNYGVIFDIIKDEIELFDYYDDTIDMRITISNHHDFLYKLDGDIDNIIDYCDVYFFQNNFYVKPNNLNFIQYGYLLENSGIVYGDEIDVIINRGKKVLH